MMKYKARTDDGKMSAGISQLRHVTLLPAHIRKSLLLGGFARLFEHCGSEVYACSVAIHAGEGARQQSGPAADIQNGVFRPCVGGAHNQFERLLVAYTGRLRKGHSLTGELVKNARAV